MEYRAGAAFCELVTIRDSVTGAATDPTSITATAYKNGVADGSFTITATSVSTGLYKLTGTVPAGYVAGDVFQIVASITIDSAVYKQELAPHIIPTLTGFSLAVGGLSGVTIDKEGYKLATDGLEDVTIDKAGYSLAANGLSGVTIDKEGYKLAADGLEEISTVDPDDIEDPDFREMLVALYLRAFGENTRTGTQIKSFKRDGGQFSEQNYTASGSDQHIEQAVAP